MLPWVSCELVQSMEIWVLLMSFPQTLLLSPFPHSSCWRASPSAQGAVPSGMWQPFQAGLRPRDKLFDSVAISRCETHRRAEETSERGGTPSQGFLLFLYNNFVFSWALCLLMELAGSTSSLAMSESFEMNFNRSRTTTIFLHWDYSFSALTDVNPQSSTDLSSAALEGESKDGHVL